MKANKLIKHRGFFKKTVKRPISILKGILLAPKIKALASTIEERCKCSGGYYEVCMVDVWFNVF